MAKSRTDKALPRGYVPLAGSERRPSREAKLLGPADESKRFSVTIQLRRRADGPPLPGFDYFAKTPPGLRKKYTQEEFAEKFGAHPDDIKKVVEFAKESGLEVVETHAARRSVVVSGTVAQMSKAFAVTLGRYERTAIHHGTKEPYTVVETYRGRDGNINIPAGLSDIIVGVFGLDSRRVSHRNQADPPNTTTVTIQEVAKLYNFPTNSAAGQTIGIVSQSNGFGGYFDSDLQTFFGTAMPAITPISADGTVNGCVEAVTTVKANSGSSVLTFASTAGIKKYSYPYSPSLHVQNPYNLYVIDITPTTVTLAKYDNATHTYVAQNLTADLPSGTHIFFNPDGETTQDICIAATAAPGADIAVFFSVWSQNGWITTIQRAAFPNPGDPVCSVLSSSFFLSGGDDPYGMNNFGVTQNMLTTISEHFRDAAIMGNITICIASGDWGSNSQCGKYLTGINPTTYDGDGKAHVIYPASDPWILSVGGTTIGNIGKNNDPLAFDEYVWNDPDATDPTQWGTTGGGISDLFPRPPYQDYAGIPPSVNDGHYGRGLPDVAGNGSYNSGYSGIIVAGRPDIGNGTSASTPHWAALIAVINAALGYPVGFINPYLYQFGSSVFRDISAPPGPTDNSNLGITGYPAGPGWDACTGWGSPNGVSLLSAFQNLQAVYISGGYQSYDVILTDLTTSQQVPVGGAPGGPWDTLLKPGTDYGFSARVHNDSGTPATDVVVRFWAIPGGVATNGTQIGAPQTVTIPPYSAITVPASAPFTSAPANDHMCAVVSISGPATGCTVDATTALQIPDPGPAGCRACAAWRNTDSMTVPSGGSRFTFRLGLGKLPAEAIGPVTVKVQPRHVPAAWKQIAKVKEIANILTFVGTGNILPLYLLPDLNEDLHTIHLNPKIIVQKGGVAEARESGIWHLVPQRKEKTLTFDVSGEIPKNAKKGDIVLVKVTAEYPKMQKRAARSVEFLEVIHVAG